MLSSPFRRRRLSLLQICTYGRQLVLSGFGPTAQAALLRGRALIVGLGGLGGTAALHLAAAGVGALGLVDPDVVAASNLHRQVAYTTADVGHTKAAVCAAACAARAPGCSLTPLIVAVVPGAACRALVSDWDVVLDCTDNAAARYALSDACAAAGRPLVAGAAVAGEASLTVYNHNSGPCLRCVWPHPPLATTCPSCADAGVLGPVPAVIGALQSLEAIKLLTGTGTTLAGRMIMFDGFGATVRTLSLGQRRAGCPGCGALAIAAAAAQDSDSALDSAVMGVPALEAAPPMAWTPTDGRPPASLLAATDRLHCAEYAPVLAAAVMADRPAWPVLLDVRRSQEVTLASLPGSVAIPLANLSAQLSSLQAHVTAARAAAGGDSDASVMTTAAGNAVSVVAVCRRGNDSQRAVVLLRAAGVPAADLIGGLETWTRAVDPSFPTY